MFSLAAMERLLFPAFLFFFEVVFLVIFGLLVVYDEEGAPEHELSMARLSTEAGNPDELVRNLLSSLGTTKTYPCTWDNLTNYVEGEKAFWIDIKFVTDVWEWVFGFASKFA